MAQSPLPSQIPDENTLNITVEFTGGLELLFDNISKHKLSIPSTQSNGTPATVKFLIPWLVDNVMVDSRIDMFVQNGGM